MDQPGTWWLRCSISPPAHHLWTEISEQVDLPLSAPDPDPGFWENKDEKYVMRRKSFLCLRFLFGLHFVISSRHVEGAFIHLFDLPLLPLCLASVFLLSLQLVIYHTMISLRNEKDLERLLVIEGESKVV